MDLDVKNDTYYLWIYNPKHEPHWRMSYDTEFLYRIKRYAKGNAQCFPDEYMRVTKGSELIYEGLGRDYTWNQS